MDLRDRDFLFSKFLLLRLIFLSFCWRLVSTESSLLDEDEDEDDDDEEESFESFKDFPDPDSDELEDDDEDDDEDDEEDDDEEESDVSFIGRAWFWESDGKL